MISTWRTAIPRDNRLAFMDQASFLALQARDQPQLVQWLWVYDRGVDMAGLSRFHHNLGQGLLGRLIERSPLPFGRHRWVAAPHGPDIEVAPTTRPRTELTAWFDEYAQRPIDPERGPGWRLGVQPFTDGSTAVSLVVSHCVVDGLGLGVVINDAVAGTRHDLGYPTPRSRSRIRALAQDAWLFVAGIPEVARAIVAAARLIRSRHDDQTAPDSPDSPRAVPIVAGRYVDVPAVTMHLDAQEWEARAETLRGSGNSLVIGFAAKLGQRMGRCRTDDATVRVIIPSNDRVANDTRANALSFTDIRVDPEQVTSDLSTVRAATREALRILRDNSAETLAALPLAPLIPKRAVRRLGDVLFAFPDLPVTCTNLGEVGGAAVRVDGTDADLVFARGVDQKVTPEIAEQKFFVGSGRLRGRMIITVIAYDVTGENSAAHLRESARQALAEFDLVATIE